MRFVQRYFTDGELAVFRQYRLTGRFAACHFLAVGIPEDMAEAVILRLQTGVFNSGLYRQLGLVKRCGQRAVHKGSERSHMQRRRLVQPYMAVDARTLVKPALLERGIRTDADKILFSVIQVFRNVIHLRGIAARFVSQVETVYPDTGITEDTVELKIKMFAEVLLWHGDGLSVPSHRVFGEFIADGFIAMTVARLFGIRQINHPVMRKIDRLPVHTPLLRIELGRVRALIMDRGCLGQIVEVLRSAAEVFLR